MNIEDIRPGLLFEDHKHWYLIESRDPEGKYGGRWFVGSMLKRTDEYSPGGEGGYIRDEYLRDLLGQPGEFWLCVTPTTSLPLTLQHEIARVQSDDTDDFLYRTGERW